MLSRSAIRRLAAALPKTSTHDQPRLSHLLRSSLPPRNGLSLPAARLLSAAYNAALAQYRRSYATAAQKTKPTARVKRDVKKAAAKKPAKKKTTTAKGATRTTAKKPAAKGGRKKKAAKPKPKPRKVVSPEKKEKAKLAELKKTALRAPSTMVSVNAWNAFAASALAGTAPAPRTGNPKLKEVAAQYKALTPAEREHWNHIANQNTATKRAEYDAWIRSHSPEQIRLANRARTALRKYAAEGKKMSMRNKDLRPLQDDRQVKRPGSVYIIFYKERYQSGDFKGITSPDASKLISQEWKALSASEKEKYTAKFESHRAALDQERQKVYGHT